MKEIETKGFQSLTEQEATSIDGGAGIASFWVDLSRQITQNALGNVTLGLNQNKATAIGGFWVNFANSITSSVLTNVFNFLKSFGL